MSIEDDSLKKLGYSKAWIDYGHLEESTLTEQIKKFVAGEDPNTEHYRYASFRKILENAQVVSDKLIEELLVLVDSDPDQSMASSVLYQLISRPDISDEQFEFIAKHDHFSPQGRLHKALPKFKLLRELQKNGISDALLEKLMNLDISSIQADLLDRSDLTEHHLQILEQRGRSKAIRNRARIQRSRLAKAKTC